MKSSIVHKLLALLSVIGEAQKPLTFSEVVEKTGLNKSTIHRLLAIAVDEGMLRYESGRRVYLLGPRVFDLVRNAYHGYDIQEIALPEMIRLHGRYDVNVTIGVPAGNEVVYLRVLDSTQPMSGGQRPGMREPVHCSASGKALLAFLPADLLHARLKDHEFTRFTERTVTNAEAFRRELDFVRLHGFGRNDREEYDHLVGISAPVFNYLGEPIAVINLWSAYSRHTLQDLIGWSDDLRLSARRITELIGGQFPVAREPDGPQ